VTASPYRAVVVADVDGTLVDRGRPIRTDTVAAVGSLDRHGALLILASGRPFSTMATVMADLSVTVDVVASNGNYLRSREGSGEVVRAFTVSVLDRAVAVAASNRAHAICFSTDGYYYTTSTDQALQDVLRTYGEPTLVCVPPHVLRQHVGEYAHIHLIRPDGWHGRVEVRGATTATSEPPYMTLTPDGVTKASGVLSILERHTQVLGPIFVVGDGENDLPLFTIPGAFTVALMSGHPRLRERADVVAPTIGDGGFAWTVTEVILPTLCKETHRGHKT
jgi:HAD superfamily hydrolase (TIGR01484 family)